MSNIMKIHHTDSQNSIAARTWKRFLDGVTAGDTERRQASRTGADYFAHCAVSALMPVQLDFKQEQR